MLYEIGPLFHLSFAYKCIENNLDTQVMSFKQFVDIFFYQILGQNFEEKCLNGHHGVEAVDISTLVCRHCFSTLFRQSSNFYRGQRVYTVLNMTSPFKYLPYKTTRWRHCACACVCRNTACFIDVRVQTRIRFALQDSDFLQQQRGYSIRSGEGCCFTNTIKPGSCFLRLRMRIKFDMNLTTQLSFRRDIGK